MRLIKVYSQRFCLAILCLSFICLQCADAQDDSTKDGPIKLFKEDTSDYKDQKSKQIGGYMKSDRAPAEEVDFKASSIEVLKDSNQVKGTDGVIISSHNTQVQADTALYNSETKESSLTGNIHITGDLGSIQAESGFFNLDTETGDFHTGRYQIEDGAYTLYADKLQKLGETEMELTDSYFSTCSCKDKEIPWRFSSRRCNVTQESYSHCYGTRLEMYDVPIFYMPYFAFPVKTERASGLLVPTFGVSSRDGFQYKQPLYLVLDDYSDMTLSPFTETLTRSGSFLDYRRAFSKNSTLSTRLLYSDERRRHGHLRGTDMTGIYDPEIDEDRFGGQYKQNWATDEGVLIPSNLVLDGHYVSDNLLLKEIDDNEIADSSSRFVTSSGIFRSALGDYFQSELSSEYNQSIFSDQELVFQRLPEYQLSGFKSWRPFGYNALGVKLVTRGVVDVTEFSRDEYYDGRRLDFNPKLSVPLRYQNYFSSSFEAGMHLTSYNLDNRENPSDLATLMEQDTSRSVPNITYRIGTGVERVYSIDSDSWLADLTSIGASSQGTRLARIKHTIEPTARYLWVPEVAQDDLPQFDELDRIRKKSIILYGLTSRLLGRFTPVRGSEDTIPEITPEVEDLPETEIPSLLDDLGGPRLSDELARPMRIRRGELRNLVTLTLLEGYNIIEARENVNPERNAFTDMTGNLTINPTRLLSAGFTSTFDRQHGQFSSWEATTKLNTDRGDGLVARYSFIDKSANPYSSDNDLSQLQAGAELVISERFRFGDFVRYDAPTGTFIENRAAIRLLSSCNCWHLDFGYSLQSNPNREKYLLSFTFGGLGGITQSIPYMGYRADSN